MPDADGLPEQLNPLHDLGVERQRQLVLYEGPIRLWQGSEEHSARGRVVFEWHHGVLFEFEASSHVGFEPEDVEVGIPELSVRTRGVVSQLSMRSGDSHEGRVEGWGVLDPTAVGPGGDLVRIDFQVVNFPPFVGRSVRRRRGWSASRLELLDESWRIRLDVVPEGEDRLRGLQRYGGYAVTLAGRLTSSDGSAFPPERGENALLALRVLLSFAAGDWAPEFLPVGFGADDERVWARWGNPVSRPWHGRFHWLSSLHPEGLEEVFPRFMDLWGDPDWGTLLHHLVDFYVEANGHVLLEPRLVLAQAGLELLAWLTSSNASDRASDRIRDGLIAAGIPTTIPATLSALATFAGERDGPWTITDMRNGLLHPPRRKALFDASRRARQEAWQLAMWYFELGLLNLLGFQGSYLSRVRATAEWDVERPPWVLGAPSQKTPGR